MEVGRFERCVENAISLVEFKIKTLKNAMRIQTASDKIKFLNEMVKILSKVDNSIEREIYIDKIAKEYGISKEAIYAEANKIDYKQHQGIKMLQKPIAKNVIKQKKKEEKNEVLIKRENMIISLLINPEIKAHTKIMEKIRPEDFSLEQNKEIAKSLYEHFEKGNSNTNVLNLFQDEELINHITSIMAEDYEIIDNEKATEDILNLYEKEKLIEEKNQIIKQLEETSIKGEEAKELEAKLSSIIIKIAKMK